MIVLDEWSKRAECEDAFGAEHAATLAEAIHPAVIQEDRDWDQTAADGID